MRSRSVGARGHAVARPQEQPESRLSALKTARRNLGRLRSHLRRWIPQLLTSLRRPSVVAIELTNRCNANCTMCGRGEVTRGRADMPFGRLRQVIRSADAAGIKAFQLSFYGEPLLYPDFVETVEFIHETVPDAVVVFNTNGALLDETLAQRILDAGVAQIRVSIDGNDKRDYEAIRIGLSYDRLVTNVVGLRRLIDDGGYKTQVLVQGLNLKTHPLAEDEYKAFWGQWADVVATRNEHLLNAEQGEPLLHRILPCPKIFTQVVVMVDGRTTICGFDWHGDEAYGSAFASPIRKLWVHPKLVRYRILHALGLKKLIRACRNCDYRMYQ